MNRSSIISLSLVASCALLLPAAAKAGLLDTLPVRIQVGNGLPLTTGGSGSLVGVSILSSLPSQGTLAGVRLLGADKTLGVAVTKLVPDGGAHQYNLSIPTGVDPIITQLITKP